jgi:hypothetical protein
MSVTEGLAGWVFGVHRSDSDNKSVVGGHRPEGTNSVACIMVAYLHPRLEKGERRARPAVWSGGMASMVSRVHYCSPGTGFGFLGSLNTTKHDTEIQHSKTPLLHRVGQHANIRYEGSDCAKVKRCCLSDCIYYFHPPLNLDIVLWL